MGRLFREETLAAPNNKQDVGELIEGLTPWAKSRARDKLDATEVDDGVAEMRAKASQVCLEIEQGDRPQPADPKSYIKRVMLNTLADFQRQRQKEPRSLKAHELQAYAPLLGDAGGDDGETAGPSGWHGLVSPAKDADRQRSIIDRPHLLARFLAHIIREDLYHALREKHRQSMQQVEAIPNGRVRAMLALYFQGHRQAAIARKLSVHRAAVSQALQRHLAAWDLDENGVNLIRLAWLYVNLEKAITEGCKVAGTCEETPEEEFELPGAINGILPANLRAGNGRSHGTGLRGSAVDQYSPTLCLTEEREVYKAIKGDSSLEAWTDDLGQGHVRDIIDALEPPEEEWDEPTWLEPA